MSAGRGRIKLAVAVAILLVGITIFATPQGRAFALRVFLFFVTTEEKSIPIPTEQLFSIPATETPVPTYILPLQPVETVAEPTKAPGLLDLSCTSTEAQSSYFCQIHAVEAEAGFDAKEFLYDPRGMKFSTVTFNPETKEVSMEFVVVTGGGYLYLHQGMGDFPLRADEWSKVPSDVIEQGSVNGNYAEIASGTFVVYPNATEAIWEPGGQWTLYWQEGKRWFALEKWGDPYPIEWIGKKEMIELAEGLVDERPWDAMPPLDPEYLPSVDAAEELAGFDVPAPTLLPAGYELKRAVLIEGTVRLLYGPKNSSDNTLNIFMGPIADYQMSPCSECPPGTDEEVQIGLWQGWYSRGIFESAPSAPAQPTPIPIWNANARIWHLTWNTDTFWFSMFYMPSSDYGGDMNKETMVRIAESMR